MLGWDQYGYHKQRTETHYVKLMFLHPAGSLGHVVHSGASEAQNDDALFFKLRWDRYGYHRNDTGTRDAELVFFESCGIYGSHSAFRCIWGMIRIQQKARQDILH
jgi:hypothetical protein